MNEEPELSVLIPVYNEEPTIERVAREFPGNDPIQGYCDLLNFRLGMAAERGEDVSNEEAFDAWAEAGFPGFPLG